MDEIDNMRAALEKLRSGTPADVDQVILLALISMDERMRRIENWCINGQRK